MKANLFAVVLSLFIIGLPAQAATNQLSEMTIKSDQKSVAKIDLNKADAKILSKSVKGFGQKRAEAIVKYREEHGNFKSVDELAHVRGLGNQFVKSHLAQLEAAFAIN